MKKIIIGVVVAVIAVGGYYLFYRASSPVPTTESSSLSMSVAQEEIANADAAQIEVLPESELIPVSSLPNEGTPPASAQTVVQTALPIEPSVIVYTDTGYVPNQVSIKSGTTVVFKNQSPQATWPASAFHPTHEVYPTTGGCLGSTFDACQGIQPGDSWSFKFEIAGTWKYHDHLHPGDTGTIVVE